MCLLSSSPQQPCAAEMLSHKPILNNQVTLSRPTRTVDLSPDTKAIKSDHRQGQPVDWTVDLSAHTTQSSRPSGLTRIVDLSDYKEQSRQTIGTNKDSGLDRGSVSPYRAVKSDNQDQPAQYICHPTQSSHVSP